MGRNAWRNLLNLIRRDPLRCLGYALGVSVAGVVLYFWAFPRVTEPPRSVAGHLPERQFTETVPTEMAPALADIKRSREEQTRLMQTLNDVVQQQEQLHQQLMARDKEIATLKSALDAQRMREKPQMTEADLQQLMARTAKAAVQGMPLPPVPAAVANGSPVPPRPVEQPPKLRTIAPPTPPTPPKGSPPAPPAPHLVLPAGSVSKGRVSNGIAAKASEQDLPFLIVVDTDFAGPNDSTVPLRDCHVVAHGSPEAIAARTRFALDTLSCVLPSGETLDTEIKGWVTAADNINGSWCEVFWNDEQILKFFGQAAIPTALVALLEQFQESVTTVSTLGVFSQSGSDVASRLLGRMGNMFLDRAEPFFTPLVWCPQNQPVHVYIEKSVSFAGVTPEAWVPPIQSQRSLYD